MEIVFADASAWIAILNENDQYHGIASGIYNRLLKEDVGFLTSSWTVYEALSMLKSKAGYQKAAKLWRMVNDPVIVKLTYIDQEIEALAVDLFFRYRDKDWGMVDCASLLIMEKTGCRTAFAFDAHFTQAARQYGFELLKA